VREDGPLLWHAWRQISKKNGLSLPSCEVLIISTNVVPIASQVHHYKGWIKWPHGRCGHSSSYTRANGMGTSGERCVLQNRQNKPFSASPDEAVGQVLTYVEQFYLSPLFRGKTSPWAHDTLTRLGATDKTARKFRSSYIGKYPQNTRFVGSQ
jgi:hypothetical protein